MKGDWGHGEELKIVEKLIPAALEERKKIVQHTVKKKNVRKVPKQKNYNIGKTFLALHFIIANERANTRASEAADHRAVELQPEMIELLEAERDEHKITNVQTDQAEEDNPHLPSAHIDLVLMVDAYHEFAFPREVMTGVAEALKPGGRVVLAEYRAENPLIMIKRLHKMSEKQVKKEMAAVGLTWVKTDDRLPQLHLLFFEKAE